jgi:hypothetical protein
MLKDQRILCGNHRGVARGLVQTSSTRNDELDFLQASGNSYGMFSALLNTNESFNARCRPEKTDGLRSSLNSEITPIAVPSIQNQSRRHEATGVLTAV